MKNPMQTSSFVGRRALTLRVAACAFLLSGTSVAGMSCTTPATEIVAGTTTQIQVPKDLAAVGVVIRFGGTLLSCNHYPLTDGTVTLPNTLGLIPQEARGEDVLEPVTLTLIGFYTEEAGQAFEENCVGSLPAGNEPEIAVMRSRRMPYSKERILFMPMPLRESCKGVACADGETCLGGLCEDAALENAVDYSDSLIFGNTNTCFSPERCLPGGLTLPVPLVDADTCTFEYPEIEGFEPTLGLMNVEIVYTSFGTEILDLDEKEGFVLDPENPRRFRLAENLCESNYKLGKILGVFAAPVCPAKTLLQPICAEDLTAIQAGARSPQSVNAPDLELCTIGDSLTASESALYVLLDRSKSMSDLYQPESLELALGLPLRNPVAARTRLAFSLLPQDPEPVCDPTVYESPELGFDDVEALRVPIGNAISDASVVLPDDPRLFLDAAMNGAYAALEDITPVEEGGQFNRRALIIVGNRDFQGACDPAEDPAALAEAALEDSGIFTYVAVLDPADDTVPEGTPQVDAFDIADAGGTTVFDAIANDEDGVLAVQKVFNDLGSCVYDPPLIPIRESATHLSYVDVSTPDLERHDIERDNACNSEEAAETVDGWGVQDDGSVRICGQPCQELRDVLTEVAKTFAGIGQPAPPVPIQTTVACTNPIRFSPDIQE